MDKLWELWQSVSVGRLAGWWASAKLWPWKEIAPWAAITVSLLWNLFNTLLGNRQWRKNQNFTEFRSLKTPVDAALGKLRESRRKLHSTYSFGGDARAFNDHLKTINKEMAENYISLTTALEACDLSTHWPKDDMTQRYDAKWDAVVTMADGIYTTPSVDEKRRRAGLVSTTLQSMIEDIAKEVENLTSAKITKGK